MDEAKSAYERTFYVSYWYMDHTGQHIGASEVFVSGALNTDKMKTIHGVLAEKISVQPEQLIVTFFAEMEG